MVRSMKLQLAICSLLVLFGWAMVETGQVANLADRFQQPPKRSSVRQIKLLAETPDYRLVEHALGKTKVPLAPRRIASLSTAATDSLVALGITPVLVTTSWKSDLVTPYLDERLRDVPKVRMGEAINLEAVLAAKPDLIFTGGFSHARLYDQLSKIAPTVSIGGDASGDRENRILDVGDVLGMGAQAQQRLADFREALRGARDTLAAAARDQPVTFLRFRRNTCVIYTRASMFGPLLFDELALTPDPAMPVVMTGGGWDVQSVERLSTLQSEYIFMVVDPDSEVYLDRVMDTPIWQNIPAVQHGHVRRVASGTWLSGDGVLGCEAIIGDVLSAIAPEQNRRADF
jgi:ferric hydroxamate/heme transport system substrate-binding protein